MIAFIDDHREAHGVEPICKVLPIAPSPARQANVFIRREGTYRDHAAKRADPRKLSARARRDAALKPEVRRVFEETFHVYGTRKVWRQLKREGKDVARCTVARLMQAMGLQGVIRGKPVRTTLQDKAAPCPLDRVNRQFQAPAPNVLWVSDFTYVATWMSFVYVAFVIDVYARRIVGWRASRIAHAGFVLDALEQAIHDRRPVRGGLVHHSDRGSQLVFNGSSQHLCALPLAPGRGPLQAFASQASCVACCSELLLPPGGRPLRARSGPFPSGSTVAAAHWYSRSFLAATGCVDRRSRYPARDRSSALRVGSSPPPGPRSANVGAAGAT